MALNIPAGFGLVSLGGRITGDAETIWSTLGISFTTDMPAGIAAAILDAWADAFEPLTCIEWEFTDCTVKAGPVETGATQEASTTGRFGNVAATCYPPNVAVLVRKVTALGGRRGRGRMYTAGGAYNGVVNGAGMLDSEQADDLDTAWFGFHGVVKALPGIEEFVLFHNNLTAPTTIIDFSVQRLLATQRRRLRP